jgi:hypothetical protein
MRFNPLKLHRRVDFAKWLLKAMSVVEEETTNRKTKKN